MPGSAAAADHAAARGRRGRRARGDHRDAGCRRYEIPRTDLYITSGLGLLVPFGDTGHRMSVDLTLATTMRKDSVMLTALSLADAQRFAP